MPSDTNTSTEQTTTQGASEGFEDMVLRKFRDFEEFMSHVHGFIGKAQPLLSTVETLASATVPGAAPVINAVTELQQVVGDLIGSIDTHFGSGKIALPPVPTAPVG